MNHKGNQKHLTFEQRVDIEKGLTENKSFAEYGQATKLLNVKNSRNRRMSAMVVEKRRIVLCQENFIHQNMLTMNTEVYWLIAGLVSIILPKAFKL